MQLSDDPYDSVRLKTESIPIFITICKIGEHCIVDPSAEEEVCSSASLVVGVSNREDKGDPFDESMNRQQHDDENNSHFSLHNKYQNKWSRIISHGNAEQMS